MALDEGKIRSIKDIKEQNGYLIYSRDIVHNYSKAIPNFLNFMMEHLNIALEKAKNGANVVWFGANGAPLVYACDAIPLSPPDMARLGRMQSINDAVAFFQIPEETCYMVKAMIGGYYRFKDSACRKIVLSGMHCEPQLTVESVMEKYGYRTFTLDTPKKPVSGSEERHINAQKHYRKEYEQLALWLNPNGYDKEKLHEELIRANRIADKLDYMVKQQQKHPSFMKALPTMLVLSGREHYYGQPQEYEKALDDIIAELESLPEGSYCETGVPLMWTGPRGVDFSVYNAIDVSGGQMVAWNLPTTSPRRYNLEIDPFDSLIEYHYFGKRGQSMLEAIQQDEKMFLESKAKGIIIYNTLGCTVSTTGIETKRRYFNDKNYPNLQISGTAQIGETTGQILTRIKAFVEMLT